MSTLGLSLLLLATPARTATTTEPLVRVDATLHPKIMVSMPYATTDNFFGQRVYPLERCALRASVAAKMLRAQEWLDQHHPGMRLLFKDCYRPHSVQFVMWKAVVGTPKSAYVANPHTATGSIHSYGAAVDVTLADAEGHEVDMGTPYDHLGQLAEPRHEARYIAEGKLKASQVASRKILRAAMLHGGMTMIPNEWWHFNDGTAAEVRRRYSRLDVGLETIDAPAPAPAR